MPVQDSKISTYFRKYPPGRDNTNTNSPRPKNRGIDTRPPQQKAGDMSPSRTPNAHNKTPNPQWRTPQKQESPFLEKRRNDLRAVAQETLQVLPGILSQIPLDFSHASMHHFYALAPLDPIDCPGYELGSRDKESGRNGTRIRVYDSDTFEAALRLGPGITPRSILRHNAPAFSASSTNPSPAMTGGTGGSTTGGSTKPILILNLANATHPCGGFLNGALAQEEALCYRSSLSLSLKKDEHYPIPLLSALYTPHCLLIREEMSKGHGLMYPATGAWDLPVTSVLTLAALCRPRLNYPKDLKEKKEKEKGKRDEKHGKDDDVDMEGSDSWPSSPEATSSQPSPSGSQPTHPTFARREDREITAYKIRLLLRLAAHQGHTKLVLGALGCGAFGNPPEEIAQIFFEVLTEEEFGGGWWEDVIFAVMDNAKGDKGGRRGSGNYGIFWRALDGVVV